VNSKEENPTHRHRYAPIYQFVSFKPVIRFDHIEKFVPLWYLMNLVVASKFKKFLLETDDIPPTKCKVFLPFWGKIVCAEFREAAYWLTLLYMIAKKFFIKLCWLKLVLFSWWKGWIILLNIYKMNELLSARITSSFWYN
jgi:hypothetical protein